MERGAIQVESLPGGLDLQSTLESGQSYLWHRTDGRMYESASRRRSAWYQTVVDGAVIRIRQRNGRLEWESSVDAVPILRERLRLDDDLDEIVSETPADPLLDRAYEAYRGMRIVGDPFFPCLVSFICSAQMRVERIHAMQAALSREYGRVVEGFGDTVRSFPEPAALADASEDALRDLGLGYRAPYVRETAEMVATGALTPDDLPGEYEAARRALTGFVGVGQKVADCVSLFSLGHLEAVPLDTWIQRAIDEHYPDCARENYDETSRAIRIRFGPYAGYAQTYVFHLLRTGDGPDATI